MLRQIINFDITVFYKSTMNKVRFEVRVEQVNTAVCG